MPASNATATTNPSEADTIDPAQEEHTGRNSTSEWQAIQQNRSVIADLRQQLEQLTHGPPQQRRVHYHPRKTGKKTPAKGKSSHGRAKRHKRVRRVNMPCANNWRGCPCRSRVEGYDFCCHTCGRGRVCLRNYHPFTMHDRAI